jgi:erythromycin esterase-like protein
MLDRLTAGTYYRTKPSAERQRAFLATPAAVRARAERPGTERPGAAPDAWGAGGLDAALWRQAIASLEVFARDAFDTDLAVRDVAAFNNARDRQMADNLLWLLRTRYPGRKVIAWGATSHLLHHARAIDTRGADSTGQARYVTMGEHVARALGGPGRGATYAVGVVASGGARGFRFPNAQPTPLPAPRPGSPEALWAATRLDAAFLDLRRLPASGAWRRAPLTAGPLGYQPFVADWTRVLDGVVYTRTMRPSTAVAR